MKTLQVNDEGRVIGILNTPEELVTHIDPETKTRVLNSDIRLPGDLTDWQIANNNCLRWADGAWVWEGPDEPAPATEEDLYNEKMNLLLSMGITPEHAEGVIRLFGK